jgi:hypothetical protein
MYGLKPTSDIPSPGDFAGPGAKKAARMEIIRNDE